MSRPFLYRINCKICEKKLDGKSPTYCKSCDVKRVKEWINKNLERYKAVREKWFQKHPGYKTRQWLKWKKAHLESHRKSDKEYQKNKRKRIKGYKTEEYRKWREKNPQAYKAQQLLNIAIKAGKIKKSPCVKCGETYRIHGHHEDYAKPYEVIWLCTVHHVERHKELSNGNLKDIFSKRIQSTR